MKTFKWIVPLFACCIMLYGCPYKSAVPIDKPGVKINPAYLGNWLAAGTEDDKYMITRLDDFTFKIKETKRKTETKAKGKDLEAKEQEYTGYVSKVDGDDFLNLKDKDGLYYIMKIETKKDTLCLKPLTDNITEKFTSSEQLKNFVKQYKGLSFFYDKDSELKLTPDKTDVKK